ncbi:MAG: hypothetical protein ABSD43_15675 [Terracidiphilus sp.]|jgi:hypothetical protein
MRLLDRLRRNSATVTPEIAAGELFAYSRVDMEEEILPESGYKCRPSVNANYKFTKAAIIIQWLRILGRDPSARIRAKEILDEFERLTFSPFQPKEISWLVEQFRKQMGLTNSISSFMGDKTISDDEIARKGLEISEGWFKLALDDQSLVVRASIMHGAQLIHVLYEEMRRIGEMVGSAVFERGRG